jgi:hypothetical protein
VREKEGERWMERKEERGKGKRKREREKKGERGLFILPASAF